MKTRFKANALTNRGNCEQYDELPKLEAAMVRRG